MQKKTRNRLLSVILTLIICSFGVYLILSNISDNIVYFYPPSEIHKIDKASNKVRVGGLVKEHTIEYSVDKKLHFIITDNIAELEIEYDGIPPALFRAGQGIIAEGKLVSDKKFIANILLAKHDENYYPPKVKSQTKHYPSKVQKKIK